MKNLKKIVISVLSVAMLLAAASCGTDTAKKVEDTAKEAADTAKTAASDAKDAVKDAVEDAADDAGFTEYPIFEDEEVGFMNVSAVYFQPVPMSNGNESTEDYDIHLECDVSALENDLGYGLGDWVPYLTVDYKVVGSDGAAAADGTFMVMSASDGPHYGANIKLDKADTYDVTFTFHSPEENGYLIHTDAETGPGGSFDEYFADGNLEVTYKGWDYTPQEW